jgi:hypothetical protein
MLEELVQKNILKRPPSCDSILHFWAHDKLQQAASSLIPEDERDKLHLHLHLGSLVRRMGEAVSSVYQEVS